MLTLCRGFLWPYIASKEGIWYDAGQEDTSFAGLFGYKVFLTIGRELRINFASS